MLLNRSRFYILKRRQQETSRRICETLVGDMFFKFD